MNGNAFTLGQADFLAGLKITDNPYRTLNEQESWEAGYQYENSKTWEKGENYEHRNTGN